MEHKPVLLNESIEGLNINPDGIYLDGTLGRGGHAEAIAGKLTNGKVIATDRDIEAIRETAGRLAAYKDKLIYIHSNFDSIRSILQNLGYIHNEECAGIAGNKTGTGIDGMIFDLGVSSPQLDNKQRGFSYMHDAALDMRMDITQELTARDIVNSWDISELTEIFFRYGEERYARQIARAVERKRKTAPIDTTAQLSGIIMSAIPAAARREQQHPAKRCFQALRIAVNDELGALRRLLDEAPYLLKPKGRICIISFHSLEDRLVKQAFNAYAKGCICPNDFPVCTCGRVPLLKLITRKPLTADDREYEANPRSRSAKLRIAERI